MGRVEIYEYVRDGPLDDEIEDDGCLDVVVLLVDVVVLLVVVVGHVVWAASTPTQTS